MNKLSVPSFAAAAGKQTRATLLFGGDFCPIGRYEKKILNGEQVFDAPLEDLFHRSDVTMVNLEAPLCEAGLPAESPGGFGLRADPQIAAFIRNNGIDVAGLSNNHIRDFRNEGVLQTMRNLEQHGVRHVGAGMNLSAAQEPLALDVNGMRLGIWALAERELNVASETSAGSSWFRPEEDMRRIGARRAEYDFLLVFLHAGHEFTTAPSPRIRQVCRSLVEAGADAIIVHHPHVIQGAEHYQGALIAYSLGNLVFDSPYVSAYANTDLGYLVRLAVSDHRIHQVDIIPCRLRASMIVTGLDRKEFDEFAATFRELSADITDESRFRQAWERNVRFRWETEYRRILNDFSRNFNDANSKDYARRSRNLFTCPTHVEMLEKAFLMLEEGKLSRQP